MRRLGFEIRGAVVLSDSLYPYHRTTYWRRVPEPACPTNLLIIELLSFNLRFLLVSLSKGASSFLECCFLSTCSSSQRRLETGLKVTCLMEIVFYNPPSRICRVLSVMQVFHKILVSSVILLLHSKAEHSAEERKKEGQSRKTSSPTRKMRLKPVPRSESFLYLLCAVWTFLSASCLCSVAYLMSSRFAYIGDVMLSSVPRLARLVHNGRSRWGWCKLQAKSWHFDVPVNPYVVFVRLW